MKQVQLWLRWGVYFVFCVSVAPLLQVFAPSSRYDPFAIPGYTLVPAIGIGFLALYLIFNRQVIVEHVSWPNLMSQILFGVFALAFFAFYYLLRFTEIIGYSVEILLFSWLFYLFGCVAMFGIFFRFVLLSATSNSLLLLGTLALLFFSLTQLLWTSWQTMSLFVAKIVHEFLGLTTTTALDASAEAIRLSADKFEVIIGPPCSGIESLTLFAALYLFFIVYEWEGLHPKRTMVVGLLGLAGVFGLNVLRVAALMLLGTVNPKVALGLFHSHAGWILFSGYVLALLYFTYPWMRNLKTSGPEQKKKRKKPRRKA